MDAKNRSVSPDDFAYSKSKGMMFEEQASFVDRWAS